MAFRNSYYRTKKVEYDGIMFDSATERDRYRILREAQKRGLISDLRLQVVFTLIPKQTELVEVKLKTKTKVVEKFHEHPLTYQADFVYMRDGKDVIEDAKGYATEDYIIRRKLMRFQGRPIREIYDPTVDYPDIAYELDIDPPKKRKSKKKKVEKRKDSFENPGLFE